MLSSTASSRLVYLDLLRILASIDIVSGHLHGHHILGGIGLPVFALTSVAMTVRKPDIHDLRTLVNQKAQAILAPWVFWSGVYAMWLLGLQYLHREPLSDPFSPNMLLYGTSIHLWFLPFILAANVAAMRLQHAARRYPHLPVVPLSVAAGVVLMFACALARLHLPPMTPLSQWLFCIPAIPLGFAVGRQLSPDNLRTRRLLLIAATSALVLLFALWLQRSSILEVGLLHRFGLGTLLVCVAAIWTRRDNPTTRFLCRHTFGVYLVHPLLLYVANELDCRILSPGLELWVFYGLAMLTATLLGRSSLKRFT